VISVIACYRESSWNSAKIWRKVLAVKAAITAVVLMLAIGKTVVAQNRDANQFLSVAFAVDGKQIACDDFRIELRFRGSKIVPNLSVQGFIVPAIFSKGSESGDDKVNVKAVCGNYTLEFSDLYPSWVSPGRWEFGIAYPPYWFEPFRFTSALEHGTWVSYLLSECNGCDPGVYTTLSHSAPPQHLVTSLRREHADASGGRARDIAYTLAVFGSEYQHNRDYPLRLLSGCLSRPKESPEDDVCNGELLDYVTNLYWRGDTGLLSPLLQVADDRRDVILEIGNFYGNLLDRRPAAALSGIGVLSVDKQQTICGLAGGDDFSTNMPKLQRVAEHLRTLGTDVAVRCLKEAETKAGRVAK
jgi:hypothetical protein